MKTKNSITTEELNEPDKETGKILGTTQEVDPKTATQFKSGEEWTGNKNGRPKGVRNAKTLFREAFEHIITSGNIADPEKDLFVTLLTKAQKGDMKAMRMFMEYRFGKPTQSLELKADVNTNNEQIDAMQQMIESVIVAKQESEE